MILSTLLLFCIVEYTCSYQKPRDRYNTFGDTSTSLPLFNAIMNPKWSEPYFDISVPKNVSTLVGKSAYLSCRVRNLGNKTVSWIRHRDIHILTVGTYTYTTDQRFQTTFHRDINEWTLQIKWAQERDAGMYECQVSTQPIKSYSVQLNVVDFEKDYFFDNPIYHAYNDEQNNFNSRSDIQNDMHHYQDPYDYSNRRKWETFRNSGGNGGFSKGENHRVPSASIFGGPDIYVSKGSHINLTCAIRYSPEPPAYVFWHHQDKVINHESPKIEVIMRSDKKLEITLSTLSIDKVDLDDSGKYSCTPSNADIVSVRVHVLNGEQPAAMQTGTSTNSVQCAHTLILGIIVSICNLFRAHIELSKIIMGHSICNNNGNNPIGLRRR